LTIFEVVDRILVSETFRNAVATGNHRNLRILLHQAMSEVYFETQKDMVRVYGMNKAFDPITIKSALQEVPPPTRLTLDGRLFNLDFMDSSSYLPDEDPLYID